MSDYRNQKPTIKEEEIIQAAIYKAMGNGWNPVFNNIEADDWLVGPSDVVWYKEEGQIAYTHYPSLIFNHNFAKALWPNPELEGLKAIIEDSPPAPEDTRTDEEKLLDNCLNLAWLPSWKRHLIKMVIAKDPVTYLGENI